MPRLIMALTAGLFASVAMAQVVGGYTKVSVDDPAVVKAAEFAVKEQAAKEKAKIALVKVEMAEKQIVAGVNYRVNLAVKLDGAESSASAVVWSKLDKTMELSKWTWLKPEKK